MGVVLKHCLNLQSAQAFVPAIQKIIHNSLFHFHNDIPYLLEQKLRLLNLCATNLSSCDDVM